MIWPFGHSSSTPWVTRFLLAPTALTWVLSACVPSIDLTLPAGTREGALVVLFTPQQGPAKEMWVFASSVRESVGLAGPGDTFIASLLAYGCEARFIDLDPGAHPLLGATISGRPLPAPTSSSRARCETASSRAGGR